MFPDYFLDVLDDGGHLYKFLCYFVDDLIDSDDLGYYFFNFYEFRNLNEFLFDLLNLIDLGKSDCFFYDFFNDFLHSDYIIDIFFDGYNFFYNCRDFLNDFLYVGNDLLNFFYLFFYQNLLYILLNLVNLYNLFNHWDDLLDYLGSRDYPLYNLLLGNDSLHHGLHWNRNLKRNDNVPLNLNYFGDLIS